MQFNSLAALGRRSRTKTKKLLLLPAALTVMVALFGAHDAQAKLYKWVDEQGNVTYSQQRPPDQKAQTIELRGIESADPQASRKFEALRDRADTARKDREFAESESAANKSREERIKDNCEIARKNVRLLQSSSRIQDKGEDGKVIYLDDNAIKAKLQEARQQVENYCG